MNRPHGSRGEVGFFQPLAHTRKVSYEELPWPVKRTIQHRAHGAPVEDAERGTLNGRTVYEIAFKRGGVHNELRVYSDGQVVQHIAGNNMVFPGTIRLSEVPRPVQQTIERRIGSAEINDIDRMRLDGRTVYEVGYKRGDGVQREMQISENGSVIHEASGAHIHR